MKKLLLSVAALVTSFFSFGQTSIEVVSYPTEFAYSGSGTIYGPSVDQDPMVVVYKNVPNDATGADKAIFCPIWGTATANAGITGTIPASGDVSTVTGGNGAYGPSLGTVQTLHNIKPSDATVAAGNANIVNYVDNGDGTADFALVFSRFNIATTPTDETTEWTAFARYFNTPASYAVPVKLKSGSTTEYEVAGMVYSSTATIEDLAILQSKGATLTASTFSKADISGAISPNPVDSVLTVNVDTDTYSLIDLAGNTVLTQAATGSIDVSGLTPGVYLLSTEAGTAKVVVE